MIVVSDATLLNVLARIGLIDVLDSKGTIMSLLDLLFKILQFVMFFFSPLPPGQTYESIYGDFEQPVFIAPNLGAVRLKIESIALTGNCEKAAIQAERAGFFVWRVSETNVIAICVQGRSNISKSRFLFDMECQDGRISVKEHHHIIGP